MKKKETENKEIESKKAGKKETENQAGLEELFVQLDGVLSDMEEDKVSLEEAFALYQKGIALVKLCNEKIDYVEKEIRILNESGGEEDDNEL